jgi:hypothetical protein
MNCLSQGAAKSIEVALECKFGIVRKVSPRFIAKMSNTTPDGNDMFSVGDAIRKYGFVWEEDWPYGEDMTWNEYYATPTAHVMAKAKENWNLYDITYEIVGVDNKQLDEVMPYGMPAVIGHAWELGDDGMFHSYHLPPNHCFNKACKQKPNKSKPCFDSYPADYQIDGDYPKEEFIKVLAPDYEINYAMLYYVNLRDPRNWLNKLMQKFKKIYRDIHGTPWFVKPVQDGKAVGKQKIDSLNSLIGALIDEFGVENNNVPDEKMNKMVNWVFFR